MAMGTVNAPGKNQTLDPEKQGLQTKLTGTEGQYVGFDAAGKAVAMDPIKGISGQYIGFDESGKQVAKTLPTGGGGESGAKAYFGTISTEWTKDNTGVKTQLVALEGVTADMALGILDVINTHERTSEGYAAFVEENNQFLQYITNGDAELVDGGVRFYIYGDANTVEIPFALEVG